MKLIDFKKHNGLNQLRQVMRAEYVELEAVSKWQHITDDKLRELLETGETEIDFSEIEVSDGAFYFKGQSVLAYIRDQRGTYSGGYKFHIANCQTITGSRASRYVITNDTSGAFKINTINDYGETHTSVQRLSVCKNCLRHLSYKGYQSASQSIEIYNEFSLKEFFKKYQKTTIKQSNYKDAATAPVNQYSVDFKQVSRDYRESKNYQCESCGIHLKNEKKYCHTHHVNGDKTDNSSYNLKCLCIECHANEDMHEHMKESADYREFQLSRALNQIDDLSF